MKIPFGYLPSHWGLKGKTREIAKAEYELAGYELAIRLHELNKNEYELDDTEYKRQEIEIKFKYNKITEQEYKRNLVSLIKDDVQRALAEAELDHSTGQINDLEYDKKVATLKKEPWVTVINMDFARKTSLEGSFELDWNEYFVEKLRNEGYNAPTPDGIVNQWFMEVCRNVALEEFDGVGNFTADSESNLETMKRWTAVESFPEGRKGYK